MLASGTSSLPYTGVHAASVGAAHLQNGGHVYYLGALERSVSGEPPAGPVVNLPSTFPPRPLVYPPSGPASWCARCSTSSRSSAPE